jgi:ubiquinone/menaquinone biosynthesis C-methylase UbiE
MDAAVVGGQWPPDSFDLVTACMALHDSPDTDRILAAARQVLTPVGRLAFSIVHPVAAAPSHAWERGEGGEKRGFRIDRYFDSGPYVIEWNMARLTTHWATPQWHRTVPYFLIFVLRPIP